MDRMGRIRKEITMCFIHKIFHRVHHVYLWIPARSSNLRHLRNLRLLPFLVRESLGGLQRFR